MTLYSQYQEKIHKCYLEYDALCIFITLIHGFIIMYTIPQYLDDTIIGICACLLAGLSLIDMIFSRTARQTYVCQRACGSVGDHVYFPARRLIIPNTGMLSPIMYINCRTVLAYAAITIGVGFHMINTLITTKRLNKLYSELKNFSFLTSLNEQTQILPEANNTEVYTL